MRAPNVGAPDCVQRLRTSESALAWYDMPPRSGWSDHRWISLTLGAAVFWAILNAALSVMLHLQYSRPSAVDGAVTIGTLDYWSALYFTVTNMTRVGFGDIAPVSPGARALAIVNGLVGVALFGLMTGAVLLAMFRNDAPCRGQTCAHCENMAAPVWGWDGSHDAGLAALREAEGRMGRSVEDLAQVVRQARTHASTLSNVAQPTGVESLEPLCRLLVCAETKALLKEAQYARARLARAVLDLRARIDISG